MFHITKLFKIKIFKLNMNETIVVIVLAMIFIIFAYILGRSTGKRFMFEVMTDVMEKEKKKSLNQSRAVIKGQIYEQFAPFNNQFPVNPSECSFLGKPIDFVCFKGLDNREIEEIIFIDIKTGNSQLSKMQKSLKKAVDEKRVRFETINMK